MLSIGDEIKAQIKTLKESIPFFSQSSSATRGGSSTTAASPFVTYIDDTLGERTLAIFIYGSSDFGGEDIVTGSSQDRKVFRKFLELR